MMPPDQPAQDTPNQSSRNAVLQELKRHVGPRNFAHWFHEKITVTIAGQELILGVGSPFLLAWMQKQFREAAQTTARAILGPKGAVRFDVDPRLLLKPESQDSSSSLKTPKKRSAKGSTASGAAAYAAKASAPRRGRRFADLAEFVEGPCNQLALTAAKQVCDAPGTRLNPLFLYGGVGTGKSHLLEGVYRRLCRQFPSLKVLLLSAETFANYFTQALRDRTLPSFRQRFRTVDVLLVDDVDFFESKRVIQEEFLHTFQQLESHDRQIVLTGDRHPRLLKKVSDELVTRFLSGLVCRVESPDFETRQLIVRRKAARLDAEFTPEALTYVAQRFKNNVRELEGALNSLATHYCMTGKRVNLTKAREVLADLERDCVRIIRMADVEHAVCNFFHLKPADLKSPRRHRSVSQARMLAMFLVRKHTRAAYSEIGRYFGGRNHSTVISAERRVANLLEQQTGIRVASETWPVHELLETLEQQLQAS